MTTMAAPAPVATTRRPAPARRTPSYRVAETVPGSYRPAGSAPRRPAAGSHRSRPTYARCDDPRAAARAAAVRRRHILLGVLAVALLAGLALPWSGRGSAALARPGPASVGTSLRPHAVYVVRSGDTLWSIAERLDPQGDPRPTMARLAAQVGGDTVKPGERLVLP